MQLLWMALVLGLFLHDAYWQSVGSSHALIEPGWLMVLWFGPKLVIGGLYAMVCRATLGRLGTRSSHQALRLQDKATLWFTLAVVGTYGADLGFGVLERIRSVIGDPVLIDELVLLLPILGLMVFSWAVSYPIDRRLREASVISRLDSNRPVYPIWTRGQFIISNLRHQTALILGPLLVLYAWVETVNWLGPAHFGWVDASLVPWLTLGGAAAVFLGAPLVIRHIWDCVALPMGELRTRLETMCQAHHVKVRELLLWRTAGKGGGIVNAAVMGVFGPLRYILITDALLDQIDQREVEAVMAHELAHVRKHHMFWMIAAAGGGASILEMVVVTLANYLAVPGGGGKPGGGGATDGPILVHASQAGASQPGPWQAGASIDVWWQWLSQSLGTQTALLALVGAVGAVAWIVGFGWISRRIERQADAFAVCHLAHQRQGLAHQRQGPLDDSPAQLNPDSSAAKAESPQRGEVEVPGPAIVDHDSVQTMVHALEQVARLNHVRPTKTNWRHGSIAWRQAYLRTLIGCPLNALPIDRQMRWIKIASAAVLVLIVVVGRALGGVY